MTQPPRSADSSDASPPPSSAVIDQALRLARLHVPEHERASFARDFARVLESFALLRELDVSGLEPLRTPSTRVDSLRDDRLEPAFERERLLEIAPQAQDGFFAVPKTIGGER